LLLENQGALTPILIGAAGLLGRPDLDGEVEVGFGVLPEHRGQGLGALAIVALTRWAQARGAKTVVAHAPADHEMGQRALQKNGFAAESQPCPGDARFVLLAGFAR
jgi:RimJ/RimL family protein N-acetyltransferase